MTSYFLRILLRKLPKTITKNVSVVRLNEPAHFVHASPRLINQMLIQRSGLSCLFF